MKFSIVTPSFNQDRFIGRNIESVLSQDYPDFEHIVVDGGSRDGTVDSLRSYPHLRWVSEPDRGQSHAVNKGFAMATGEVLGWLNADDTYAPGAFQAVKPYFEIDPDLGMVYGYCNMIDERDRVITRYDSKPWDLRRLIRTGASYVCNQTVFLRRRVYEEVGDVDEDLHFAMDYDYWIRVGRRFKVQLVPHLLGSFRHHDYAKSYSGDPRIDRERKGIRSKYLEGGGSVERLWELYYDARTRLYQLKFRLLWARRGRSRPGASLV